MAFCKLPNTFLLPLYLNYIASALNTRQRNARAYLQIVTWIIDYTKHATIRVHDAARFFENEENNERIKHMRWNWFDFPACSAHEFQNIFKLGAGSHRKVDCIRPYEIRRSVLKATLLHDE